MKRFKKLLNWQKALTISLLFVLLLTVSCSKKEPEPSIIKVGVVGPLTGEGATYGESMRRGFELAFQKEPSIKLIYEDSKLSPKEGVAAIQKLISADKVQVVGSLVQLLPHPMLDVQQYASA